jgi:ComF family protein
MRKGKSILKAIFAGAGLQNCGHALLPPLCLLCGAPGGDQPVCPDCQADLPLLPTPCCPVCLEATAQGERCGACLVHPPCFERVFALYRYAFPVDRLIHDLKYGSRFALARWWGYELARELAPVAGVIHRVMPLPLHVERLSGRGYNQALELARVLSRVLETPLDIRHLEKCRATPPQSQSSAAERRRNLRNAFVCHADLRGQRVLLVDDVMTTGATLSEAARVLKQRGAVEVWAAVVARTLKSQEGREQ